MVRSLLIFGIRIYQRTLGPLLRCFNGGWGHCRHVPTCSNYAIQALSRHGALRGSWLAMRRLLRCHPWGTSGEDPVPEVFSWRGKGEAKRNSGR